MSRNLLRRDCYFCAGVVKTVEAPRLIRANDCGVYLDEYRGMPVAWAECVDCEAKYIAWLDDGSRSVMDLSFRSTFNDEPGAEDLPRFRIVVTTARPARARRCRGALTPRRGVGAKRGHA